MPASALAEICKSVPAAAMLFISGSRETFEVMTAKTPTKLYCPAGAKDNQEITTIVCDRLAGDPALRAANLPAALAVARADARVLLPEVSGTVPCRLGGVS